MQTGLPTGARRLLKARRGLRLRVRAEFPWRRPHTPRGVDTPANRKKTGTNFDTAWARRWPSRFARALVVEAGWRPVIAYFAKPQRRGLDRLAQLDDQPVIFAANHRSHADTPLLLTSIPEPWRHKLVVAAAADYFFRNRLAGTASALGIGAIPIERHQVERSSSEYAAGLINEGWSLLLYPEGGRTSDGWGIPFRAGGAYLASKCQVPVVPVFLAGTRSILRRGKWWPNRSSTAVIFGSPMMIEPDESLRSFNDRIELAVAALSDEFSTNWWQARRRFHANQTPDLTGPKAASWLRNWNHERSLEPPRQWPK